MPTALDLVQNVTEKKPSEFHANFSELVTDRIRDLIAGKRVEVAKNLFNPQPPVEVVAQTDENPDENPDSESDTETTEKETTDADDSAEATA